MLSRAGSAILEPMTRIRFGDQARLEVRLVVFAAFVLMIRRCSFGFGPGLAHPEGCAGVVGVAEREARCTTVYSVQPEPSPLAEHRIGGR